MNKSKIILSAAILSIAGAVEAAAEDPGTAGPLAPVGQKQWQCVSASAEARPRECELPEISRTLSRKERAIAHLERGVGLFQGMRFQEAGKDFASAVDLDPSSFKTHLFAARYELGMLSMHMEDKHLEAAERHLREAERLAPADVDVITTRAYVLWYWLRRAEAMDIYNSVIESHPEHVFAHKMRARIHFAAGRFKLALADYDALLTLQPENHVWRRTRADTLLRLGRHAQAAVDLAAYLEKNPFDQDIYIMRATAHTMSGNWAAAVKDLSVVLDGTKDGMKFALGGEHRAGLLMKRSFLLFGMRLHDRAVADALEAMSTGGTARVLRLQLFLKKRGLDVRIDGKVSEEMRQAIKDCLGVQDCAARMFQQT